MNKNDDKNMAIPLPRYFSSRGDDRRAKRWGYHVDAKNAKTERHPKSHMSPGEEGTCSVKSGRASVSRAHDVSERAGAGQKKHTRKRSYLGNTK